METRKRRINLTKSYKFNDAWAFVFFVLISGSLIGISLYKLFKSGEFKNFGQTSLPKKTGILFAYNIVCMLFLNLLWLLMLTVVPKFLIYAGLFCGPVLSLIIFVMSFLRNGMAPKIFGGVSFLLSLLASIITFYAIRKQIDAICLLVSKGTAIIIQNIFKVFLLYLCAIVIVSFSTFSITIGVNGTEKANTILNYFNTFVVFWVIVFFAYLYDVFGAALVKNHVIKATGKDDEEKSINVGVKSLAVVFFSLGTIAFSSFIIALIRTCRYIVEAPRERRENSRSGVVDVIVAILSFLLAFILIFLENLIDAMNKFALCYTAMKNTGFKKSVIGSWDCLVETNCVSLNAYVACEYAIYVLYLLNVLIQCSLNFGYFYFRLDKNKSEDIILVVLSSIFFSILSIDFVRIAVVGANALSFIYVLDPERIAEYSPQLFSKIQEIAK